MYTFSEYQVATTHNSFLPHTQIFDCSSVGTVLGNIRQQLESGIRCLEFDIHGTGLGRPVVTHGNRRFMCTRLLDVDEVLGEVAKFMDSKPSPVILDFQLETSNLETQNLLADSINDNLGKFHRRGIVNFLTDYPEHYIGNVILTCSGGLIPESRLCQVINIPRVSTWWFYNRDYKTIIKNLESVTYNYLRVYPNNYIFSRNFDPEPLLKRGVQMVAINYVPGKELRKYMSYFPSDLPLKGYRPISLNSSSKSLG